MPYTGLRSSRLLLLLGLTTSRFGTTIHNLSFLHHRTVIIVSAPFCFSFNHRRPTSVGGFAKSNVPVFDALLTNNFRVRFPSISLVTSLCLPIPQGLLTMLHFHFPLLHHVRHLSCLSSAHALPKTMLPLLCNTNQPWPGTNSPCCESLEL